MEGEENKESFRISGPIVKRQKLSYCSESNTLFVYESKTGEPEENKMQVEQ